MYVNMECSMFNMISYSIYYFVHLKIIFINELKWFVYIECYTTYELFLFNMEKK